MPWIDKNRCDGCQVCIEECPVEAISMVDEKAEIDMEKCIRCGTCHDVCPQDASRHDSEKIPEEVAENIEWVKGLLAHYQTDEERKGFLKRIKKYFTKEIKVNEKTIEKVDGMFT